MAAGELRDDVGVTAAAISRRDDGRDGKAEMIERIDVIGVCRMALDAGDSLARVRTASSLIDDSSGDLGMTIDAGCGRSRDGDLCGLESGFFLLAQNLH